MKKESIEVKYNLIIKEKSLISIYKLEPVDLIILPEDEQKIFLNDMDRMLSSLREANIQIIMRTRKAVPQDFYHHFDSLRNNYDSYNKQDLVNSYISELSHLIDINIIPVKEYYLVFKQNIKNDSTSSILNGIKAMRGNIERIANNIMRSGIEINQVVEKELENLLITFTRNI